MESLQRGKQGQIELTFNWVYILIAGVVIILFFVGIAMRQKTVSEQQLSSDVVRIMESIFTSAGVSEKTKNFIQTSGLADYTLYFRCEDGVGEYGIKDTVANIQNAVNPLFAPAELRGTQLILWSLPYKLPFKVIDFLYATTSNTKYFAYGSGLFANEFIENTEGFNVEQVTNLDSLDPGKNYQVRIIDFNGVLGQTVPSGLDSLDDDKVTVVSFVSENSIVYYRKQGNNWLRINNVPVTIISLDDEKDAAKYGAIFAADGNTYQCNMQKAFRRLGYDIIVHQGKREALYRYYERQQQQGSEVGDCLGYLEIYQPNLQQSLGQYHEAVKTCQSSYSLCSTLPSLAQTIKTTNNQFARDCSGLMGLY